MRRTVELGGISARGEILNYRPPAFDRENRVMPFELKRPRGLGLTHSADSDIAGLPEGGCRVTEDVAKD